MIVFDLSCEDNHHFEGWFRNAEEYQQQLDTGLLTCPICGSEHIYKLLSPSRINLGRDNQNIEQLVSLRDDAEDLARKIQKYVSENFEDVGTEFASEAKKIHYGQSEERNIHGTASKEEIIDLYDEGIDAIPLVAVKPDKDKLN